MELPEFLEKAWRSNPYEGVGTWIYERLGPPVIMVHHRRLAERLARELPHNARVLDIGSGPGDFFLRLALLRRDLECVGLDPAESAVDRASRRARREGLANVSYRHGTAEQMPVEDGFFDVAVSTGSYKHWGNRPAGFKETLRVLRPGGDFFLYELDPAAGVERMKGLRSPLGSIGQNLTMQLLRRFIPATSVPQARAREDVMASEFILVSDDVTPDLPFYEFVLRKPTGA